MVAVSWEGAPPEREEPHCESPYVNLRVDSAQPVRTPGPAILLKLPFETAFPKLSGPGMGSNILSISLNRGRRACVNDEESVGEVVVGVDGELSHCRTSYTSSVIIRASYLRANLTSFIRWDKDMVFPEGLENVGTQ